MNKNKKLSPLKEMELAKEKEILQMEINIKNQIMAEQNPKKDYLDKILEESNLLMSSSQIAIDYGIENEKLNEIAMEWQYNRNIDINGSYLFDYGYAIDKFKFDEDSMEVYFMLWTQKGRVFLHNILTSRGIIALQDR